MMQDYVGATKSKEILETGRWWLDSIGENEMKNLAIRNPHDLVRALECDVRLAAGKIIIESSLARTTGSHALDFHRVDAEGYTEPQNDHYVTLKLAGGKVQSGELPMEWWLGGDYSRSYEENYRKFSKLSGEGGQAK